MAFGDVFAGWQEAASKHYGNLLKMEYEQRKELAEKYALLGDDTRYDPTSQTEFKKRAFNLLSLEPGKKIPKEYSDFSIKVQPPTPKPLNIQGSPESPGDTPGPVDLGGEFPPVPQKPTYGTAAINPRTIEMPAPAPHALFEQQPYEKQMENLRSKTDATQRAMAPQKVTGGTTMMDGRMVGWTKWRDPVSGREWSEIDEHDKAFAPRMANAAPLDIDDLIKLQAEGLSATLPPDTDPAIIRRIGEILPGSDVIQDPSSGRMIVRSARYRQQVAGGINYQIQDTSPSGQPFAGAAAAGVATGALPQTRVAPQVAGVNKTTGTVQFRQGTTSTTTGTPGLAGAPQPPPGLAVQPQPQGQMAPPAPPPPGLGSQIPGVTGQVTPKVPAQTGAPQQPPAAGPVQQQPAVPRGTTQAPPAAAATTAGEALRKPNQANYIKQPYAYRAPAGAATGATPGAGMHPGILAKEREMQFAIAPAAQMLFGDPKNPTFESLEQFADLMDNAGSRERVGSTFRLIKEGLGNIARGGGDAVAVRALGMSTGIGSDISGMVKNWLGIPGMVASMETKPIEDKLATMSDREKRMVARLLAAYGTIVGIRKITSGGAYQFSVDAMEREIPVPGITGVDSSKLYNNKLAQLAEEVATPADMMYSMPPDKKDFLHKAAVRLSIKGQAERTGTLPNGVKVYQIRGKYYDEFGNTY